MRAAAVTMALCLTLPAAMASEQSRPSGNDLATKIDRLVASPGTLDDVLRIFGEPQKYVWGPQTYTKQNLPDKYWAVYPNLVSISMAGGRVQEIEHKQGNGFLVDGKIGIGSTLEAVLAALGQPASTVTGQPSGWQDGVLYKDIDGNAGQHYYARKDKKVRLFFLNGRVCALYQTIRDEARGGDRSMAKRKGPGKVSPFDDVRGQDISIVPFGGTLASTLRFNQDTKWPPALLKAGPLSPAQVLEAGKNPGLGVRTLHRQGITGKDVNVAIIDQPLYDDHPEFAGKIVAYHDVGCQAESSMHGPAVASLLVGETCGTAPGARLYYAAAPSWRGDSADDAKALNWIIEQNNALPADQKIRVVSVSAAPSGPGSPRTQNQSMWDDACKRAEAAGILVLDCTQHHGLIGPGYYDRNAPEAPMRCSAGFPGGDQRPLPDHIVAPCSGRTTAEEYTKGECKYAYWGRAGLSWTIPYVAGVLAMGWQVHPDATPQQMRDWLFRSAATTPSGAKIINPLGFVGLVRSQKAAASRPVTSAAKAAP